MWTPDEIALVQEVADRIWATLEHRKAEAELRANEERLAFLLRLNDALRPLSDAGGHPGNCRTGISASTSAPPASAMRNSGAASTSFAASTPAASSRSSDTPLRITVGGALGEALRRGETIVVNDVQADQRLSDDDRAAFRSRQIAAFVGMALFKDGQMVAAFGANHDTPRVWTAAEVELVRDVAERTWDAVERTRAEAALREQKQRLRLALEASAGGSWTWVPATNEVDWDERFRALYGFAPDEPATPDAWMPRVHEDDRPRVLALLRRD